MTSRSYQYGEQVGADTFRRHPLLMGQIEEME